MYMYFIVDFINKDELLSHLTLGYQQAVEDKSVGLITYVQDLLSVVETFIKIHFDTEVSKTDHNCHISVIINENLCIY